MHYASRRPLHSLGLSLAYQGKESKTELLVRTCKLRDSSKGSQLCTEQHLRCGPAAVMEICFEDREYKCCYQLRARKYLIDTRDI